MASNLTFNLRKWIGTLEQVKDASWKTAFIEAYNQTIDQAHNTLTSIAKAAAESLEEYNLPIFTEPLKIATQTRGCIVISANTENSISIIIDMDATAGNIEDYASAVRRVRASKANTMGWRIDKNRASWYWRNFIYGQAREGFTIKKKRVKGQLGRTPIRRKEGKQLYTETISERLAAMGTLAPYWSLIDKGNASVSSLDEGGTPYPANGSTNFTTTAALKIRTVFVEAYRKSQQDISNELELVEYGSNGLLESIQDVVTEFERSSSWTPGDILKKLEIGERMYELHITKMARLGMRLSN